MSERRTVLVTGASRGIGAATARLFAARGWNVGVHCFRSADRAEALCRELGEAARPYRADVADRAQVFAMVAALLRDFGGIDALVCCAGIARQELFDQVSEAAWREMMGVDLDGTAFCCQAVLPSMLGRKRGRIVTVSSMWGQVGGSCEVAYSAAKAGVIGLTKALAKEVGPSGITVNCVAPAAVETDMMAGFTVEDKAVLAEEAALERLVRPEEIAETIWFLASDAGGCYTGQVLAPNAGAII